MDTWDLKRIKAFKHAAEKPLLLDILFAGVLSWAVLRKAAADDHVAMGDVIVAFVAFVAVLLRRVRPRVALGIAVASTVGAILHGVSNPGLIAALGVITYSIAAHTSRRKGLACALLGSALIYVTGLIVAPGDWWRFESLAVFAWIFMAAAVGDAVRTHKAYIHEVEERARHAEQTREDEARRRVMDERVRIARELHDVVAHHIAVISVQAGAAAHILERRPDQVGPALAHIREASDTVLREIQSVVGVLRNEDEATSTEPAPGLARLPELLTALESAHFSVRPQQRGLARELPALVDLAAYRIVQEALTNAHKHGIGPVRLLIEYAPSGVILEVTNEIRPGSPAATRPTTASGATAGSGRAGLSAAGSVAAGLSAAGSVAAGLSAARLGAARLGAAGSGEAK
ncbi:sensor histidine kinase, partial [Winogradskya humida]